MLNNIFKMLGKTIGVLGPKKKCTHQDKTWDNITNVALNYQMILSNLVNS
jgi:hypothetical protein